MLSLENLESRVLLSVTISDSIGSYPTLGTLCFGFDPANPANPDPVAIGTRSPIAYLTIENRDNAPRNNLRLELGCRR